MINLHTKSAGGNFDSILTNSDLISEDKIITVVDSTMFNVVSLYKNCKAASKKLVFGLDICTAFGNVESLISMYGKFYGKLTLIAKNYQGYQNLVKLSTYSYLKGFYQKPRIDLEFLLENNEGLICLIDSLNSNLAMHIENDSKFEMMKEYKTLKGIFKEKLHWVYFLNAEPTEKVKTFIQNNNEKVIASNIVKYQNPNNFDYWKYLMCINNNINTGEFDNNNKSSYCKKEFNDFYYCIWLSEHAIMNLFDLLEEVEDYNLDQKELKLPDMGIPDEDFIENLFRKLEEFGLNTEKYIERLSYELDTIMKFGYKDYFLLVKDVVDYANRELSGYLSAGRGSVGGCLIAYLLGITRINPVNPKGFDMEIPFDRFLNSGRKVMPDIDLDFLPRDRPLVIQYLKDKFGNDSCKNMMTKVTFGARSSIREICRISGNLTSEIESIIKSFPSDQHLNLDILKDTDIYKQNEDNKIFMDMYKIAEKLEGMPRSIGVHASGIALSACDMKDNVPFFIHNGREVTQYDQNSLDYMGVIKLDILGLNVLQIMSDCLELIEPNMDKFEWLSEISLNDDGVFKFINDGLISGVFQWDTFNYKKVIENVKPNSFKELVDLNTLGRSAALLSGLTDKYIARKNGLEKIEPLHPNLDNLMSQTYELPLYQEQIMKIFIELAGFSFSEADDVRKAIGKKIPELMNQQMKKFNEGCIKNNITTKESAKIWYIIDKFSKYTWNLGHAIAYTRICYETAYLAYHYPKEFYCACINNSGDKNEIGNFISTLKKRKIKIDSCHINVSQKRYIIKDQIVYSGFTGLKFFGEKSIDNFLNMRSTGYDSIEELFEKVPKKTLNARAIKALYCGGAFDSLIKIEEDLELLAKRANLTIRELRLLNLNQYNICGRITVNPVQKIGILFSDHKTKYNNLIDLKDNLTVFTMAYIVGLREIYTKNGNKMAFGTLEDHTGRYEIVIFPSVWKNTKIKIGDLCETKLRYDKGIICDYIRKFDIEEVE